MKDKRRYEDDTVETEEFYYEVIGITLILVSLITYLELGMVGEILNIFLKLFFGEWFFIVIFFVLSQGIHTLWKRDIMTYTSQRYIGFYIFILSILTLSHFPISDYIKEYTDNEVLGTWELFMEYLKNNNDELVMGGGLIGAVCFYLFSFLLGHVGVILISVILIFISFSFMLEKSIYQSIYMIRDFSTNVNISLPSLKKHFIFEKEIDRNKKIPKLSIKTIKYYEENDNSLQNKVAITTAKSIIRILKLNNIGCEIIEVRASYQITSYVYKLFDDFNKSELQSLLEKSFESKTLFKKEDDLLIIEEANKYKRKYGLREALEKGSKGILIGINNSGEVEETNLKYGNKILINTSRLQTKTNLVENIFLQKNIELNPNKQVFFFFDPMMHYKNYNEFKNVNYKNEHFKDFLEEISIEINTRISLFNHTSTNSVTEFNKYNKSENLGLEDMKTISVFITNIDKIINSRVEDNLNDYINLGSECGFDFIVTSSNHQMISNEFVNLFDNTITYKCDNKIESEKYIYKPYGIKLEGLYDIYSKEGTKINRVIVPFIDKKNIEKLHQKLI